MWKSLCLLPFYPLTVLPSSLVTAAFYRFTVLPSPLVASAFYRFTRLPFYRRPWSPLPFTLLPFYRRSWSPLPFTVLRARFLTGAPVSKRTTQRQHRKYLSSRHFLNRLALRLALFQFWCGMRGLPKSS